MSIATTETSDCYSFYNVTSIRDDMTEGAGPRPPPPFEPSVNKKTSQPSSSRPKVGTYVVIHPPQQNQQRQQQEETTDFDDIAPPTFEEAVSSSLIHPIFMYIKTNDSQASLMPPSMNRSFSDTICLQSKRMSSSPTIDSRQNDFYDLMQDNLMSDDYPQASSLLATEQRSSFDIEDSYDEKELNHCMASTSGSSFQSDQQDHSEISNSRSKRRNHYLNQYGYRMSELSESNHSYSQSEEMEELISQQEMILKSIQKESQMVAKKPPSTSSLFFNSGPGGVSRNDDFCNDLKPPSLIRYQTHSPSTNTTPAARQTSDYIQNLICWKCNQRYTSTLKSTNEVCFRCYSKSERTSVTDSSLPVEPKSFHDLYDSRYSRHQIHLSRRDVRPNQ